MTATFNTNLNDKKQIIYNNEYIFYLLITYK